MCDSVKVSKYQTKKLAKQAARAEPQAECGINLVIRLTPNINSSFIHSKREWNQFQEIVRLE